MAIEIVALLLKKIFHSLVNVYQRVTVPPCNQTFSARQIFTNFAIENGASVRCDLLHSIDLRTGLQALKGGLKSVETQRMMNKPMFFDLR